ncbi:MAG: AMP-binding protein [Acidimicrobiia bacterium]|nr:AMP-binding protein [Acidimicrobiia bacterium]
MWVGKGLWADETLHELFDATVAAEPEKVVLVTKDTYTTLAAWKERADALAAGLLGVGIGPGDIVAVQLPNWTEFCELQIALSRIGAVIQPLHLVFREREVRSLLDFCETDAVVVPGLHADHDYAGVIRGLRAGLPGLRHAVVTRDEAKDEAESEFEALVEEGRRHLDRLGDVSPHPDDVFYLNFTSGTEGDPKGFLHTHNTLVSLFRTLSRLMATMDAGTVNLCCSPMTHSFGHFTTYQAALGPIPMVLVDRYRPRDVLELIEREGVTSISGTPAHLYGILHHPEFASFDTTSVKNVGVGGARSSSELIEELERTWGVKSANTYGMGENILHTRTMPFDPEDKILESVGRPVFGAELRIVDPGDPTRDLPAGEVGEILFRGPTLFCGYLKQPELTAATRDGDGWFRTGDLGYVDEDGFLYFSSRAKEVINRGGTKIYPKEVEDLLTSHPDIDDAAVVAKPDPRLGETVCAYVVCRPGHDVDTDSVAAYLTARGAMRYLVPEEILVREELPMTPTGKIRKATLVADAAARASGDRETR